MAITTEDIVEIVSRALTTERKPVDARLVRDSGSISSAIGNVYPGEGACAFSIFVVYKILDECGVVVDGRLLNSSYDNVARYINSRKRER